MNKESQRVARLAVTVARLRGRRRIVRAILEEVKRRNQFHSCGLCLATVSAVESLGAHFHQETMLLVRDDLVGLYMSRLDGAMTLEGWLRRLPEGRAANLFYPDSRLAPTRRAWVDSLIKELCE